VPARRLTDSLEDYLEAIYQIAARKRVARVKDIARRLEVKASSVTGALRALAKRGLVDYAPYEVVTLTDAGREAAAGVVGRHEAVRDFLVKVLAVPDDRAGTTACKMEHAMDDDLRDRLARFVEFTETHAEAGKQVRSFRAGLRRAARRAGSSKRARC